MTRRGCGTTMWLDRVKLQLWTHGGRLVREVLHYLGIVVRCHHSLIYTETGGIMITPRPSPDNSTPKPAFPTRPFWGIDPVLVDEKVCSYVYMCFLLRRV